MKDYEENIKTLAKLCEDKKEAITAEKKRKAEVIRIAKQKRKVAEAEVIRIAKEKEARKVADAEAMRIAKEKEARKLAAAIAKDKAKKLADAEAMRIAKELTATNEMLIEKSTHLFNSNNRISELELEMVKVAEGFSQKNDERKDDLYFAIGLVLFSMYSLFMWVSKSTWHTIGTRWMDTLGGGIPLEGSGWLGMVIISFLLVIYILLKQFTWYLKK